MDISPDDSKLYLGEETFGPGSGLIREVNLDDGSSILRTFPLSGDQAGVKDLVATATGKLLISIKFNGSSSVPLLEMDLTTGVVTQRFAAVSQHTLLHRSADYSTVFIHGVSGGTTAIAYDPATQSSTTTSISNANGGFAAVNSDGSKIAMRSHSDGLVIYDASLNQIDTLPNLLGGAVFDARGDFLFVVDTGADEVVAFDTTNFDEQFRMPIGENVPDFTSVNERTTMAASADGRQVFMTTEDGVTVFSLAHGAPHRVIVGAVSDSFVNHDFGTVHPAFNASALGEISGQKWHDENGDGASSGEGTLSDWRIYADLNHNGKWDEAGVGIGAGVTLEPDDFRDGFVLNRHVPGVVFSVAVADNTPTFKLDVKTDNQDVSSTGRKVFAHAGVNFFNNTRRMRMDFTSPARAVAIDFIGSSIFSPEYGRLDLFDASNNLLDHYDTRGLWNNQVERMYLDRPTADIAYAIAYIPDGKGTFGRLDNFWFAGTAAVSEPNDLTDATGAYTISNLPSTEYDLREEQQVGWTQTFPVTLAQNTLIPLANVVDQVYNPSNAILYIATTAGDVHRYDTVNQSMLSPWSGVGSELSSIEVSPDGATLYAGDAIVSGGNGFLRKIDVATGNVANIPFAVTGNQEGVKDVAVGVNDNALFSIKFGGSSSVPLYHLNTSNDNVTQFQAAVEQHTLLSRSADRSAMLLYGSNSHPNVIQFYDASTNTVTATKVVENAIRARAAVAPDGSQVAYRSNNGFGMLETDLDTADLLAHLTGPTAFDPIQNLLYAADDPSNQIVVFDTTDNRELYRINIEEQFTTDTFRPRAMTLSSDGGQLFLSSAAGVHIYDAREAAAHRVLLHPGQSAAAVDFGNIITANVTPSAAADLYATDEDQSLNVAAAGVLANDIDLNNDDLTASLVVSPQHGSLTLNANGSFTYTPDANYNGLDTFTYRASDGSLSANPATVTINVQPVNDSPTDISLSNSSVTENEAGAVVGDITVADVDAGETFTYALSDSRFVVAGGQLKLASGQSLDREASATVSVQITATDSGNASVQKTFVIDVLDVNEFDPVVPSKTLSVTEHSAAGTLVGNVGATDQDAGQTLSYQITAGDPDDVFAIDSAGAITVSDAGLLNYESTPQFVLTVQATDNGSPTRSATGTITIDLTDIAGFMVVESGGSSSVSESGTTDTISIVLTDDPGSDVVLNVASDDTGEVTVGPASLTFTPSNWNVAQVVTLTGANDFLLDGSQITNVVVSVDDAASDDAFDPLADASVAVTTTDDDAAGVLAVETSGSTVVSEAGTSDTFTVALTAEPTSDVVLTVTASALDEATVDVASLTFTPSNWNAPQTVTVTGVDDSLLDGAQASTVTLSVDDGASDNDFDPLADIVVSVSTVDDDTAGIAITESSGSSDVSESGSTDTFDVVLNASPATDVVLTILSADTGEATVDKASLTFTPANWDTAQTVTITGADDVAVDGEQTTLITVSVDTSLSDDDYDSVPNQSVSVATADNDTAGFSVTESGGETVVSESGSTDTLDVVLTAQPLGDVVFTISASGDEASLSASSLTFNATNWNVVQTVTVTGLDDVTVDGDQSTTVTIAVDPANSDDAFDALASQSVSATTVDNDTAGFSVTESGGETVVSESGSTDTFDIALTGQPLGDVVFTITTGSGDEASFSAASLTFNASNWNVAQTVTVTGLDDDVVDGDQSTTVTIAIDPSQTTDAFDTLASQAVTATTTDDDTAGLVFSHTAGSTAVSEPATTDDFQVALTAQPLSSVVLTLTVNDATEASVDKATLTFTSSNWNSPQTVTVSGVDDPTVDGEQASTITIAVDAANSDDVFDAVASQDLPITTADDDTAGFHVTETNGDTVVNEAGTTDTLNVVLTSQPLSPVIITVDSSDVGEATVSSTSLTFTPSNWNNPQAVTVTGVDDGLSDGDQTSTITFAINDALSDDAFDPLSDQSLTATTEDDEPLWHNAALPVDVNGDGQLTVTDLRIVFTYILGVGVGPLDPAGPSSGGFYIDVDNDGSATLSDLRLVLVALLDSGPSGEPSGEPSSANGTPSLTLQAAPLAPPLDSQGGDDGDEEERARRIWSAEEDWWRELG